MQRTQNYNLCQWAAEDRILRSDFNADNQKIDAALKAANDAAPRIVTGSYTGDGQVNVTKTYDIGAKPKILFLRTDNTFSGNTYMTGLLVTPMCCIQFNSNGYVQLNAAGNPCTLTDTGFTIAHGNQAALGLNANGKTLFYCALC